MNLIQLIECQPSIWDTRSREYYNKVAKKKAWIQIGEDFDETFNDDEFIAKWSNLRIQYRWYATRAKNKLRKEPPTWKYFNALSFLSGCETSAIKPAKDSTTNDESMVGDGKESRFTKM